MVINDLIIHNGNSSLQKQTCLSDLQALPIKEIQLKLINRDAQIMPELKYSSRFYFILLPSPIFLFIKNSIMKDVNDLINYYPRVICFYGS